ncbi:MAG: GAF domain-containing protein [Chloroflexi bacterium]|nr:GAF domain-containing protein [Chloroflexota bacterium]
MRHPDNCKPGFVSLLGLALLLSTTACGILVDTPPSSPIVSSPSQPTPTPLRPSTATPRGSLRFPNQANNLRFSRLSIEQGLSQSVVQAILQDHYGFMWFGTQDGLNKYDGYIFTVYKHDPDNDFSLSNNWVTAIYEDSSGVLWIGTLGGGLDKFDRDTGRFLHYRNISTSPLSLSNNFISTIYQDRTGIMWIGTQSGLNKFDRTSQQFSNFQTDPNAPNGLKVNAITSIHEDVQGILWFGTTNGLVRYDRSTQEFVLYRNVAGDPTSLGGNNISSIYEDQSGALWIGTQDGGISRKDSGAKQFVRLQANTKDSASLSGNDVHAIYGDSHGGIWVGTDGYGLNKFDPFNSKFVRYASNPGDPFSLSSDHIFSIYEDKSGVLWIGTWGGGLSKAERPSEQFISYYSRPGQMNSLVSGLVFSVYEEKPSGALWIGTAEGLDRLDRQTGKFTHYRNDPLNPKSLSTDYVATILQDRSGGMWFGTFGGLDRFDNRTAEFTHYRSDSQDPTSLSSNVILTIYQDRSGTMWIGTQSGGLNKFDQTTGRFVRYLSQEGDATSLSNNSINSMCQDPSGIMWIGTAFGLNKFDPATGKSIRYLANRENQNSPSVDSVLAVYQDTTGMVWLGTLTGGLNRFDPQTETFKHYREKNGLANDTVYGILEDDDGFLWLSTNKGLSKFDPHSETFRNYDASYGLQSNEFNMGAYFKSPSGEMFFGGINGLTAFYPDIVSDNAYIPPVVLTALTQGGVAYKTNMALENVCELTFSWPNNYFDFEFAALSFAQPEKNQYAYQLENFDARWNPIGAKRFGRYTNLPGGTYTLRIKGSNNDGVWNEQGIALKVTIVPPFWEMLWFRGLVIGLATVLVAGGFRWRVRDIRARNRELERQVQERTWALAQQKRELEERTEQLEQRQQELQTLYQADEELHHHLHLDDVLQTLCNIAVDNLKADKSALLCWNKEHDRIVMRVAHGFSAEAMTQISFAPGEGVTGRVMLTGEPAIVKDARDDLRRVNEPSQAIRAVLTEGIRSFLHLPIQIGNETFGVFNVSYTELHTFGDKEQRLFTALAQRAALAIESARYLDSEQRRAEQFRLIAEVGQRISTLLDANRVMEQVAQLVQTTFGYYHVGIGLVEGDEIVYQFGAGELWERMPFEFKPARLKVGKEGFAGWIAAHGEPILAPNVSQDARYVWMQGSATRSELTVPIFVKDKVIGVLDAQSDRLNAFDKTDLAVLQALAHQAGAAIENAHLYERAQELAVMQERNRLARDLHDAVTQTLFSATLIADALPSSWESDPSEGRQLLKELRQLSRGALAEMRTLLLELRPTALIETKLGDLLRQLGEAAMGRTGLSVSVQVESDSKLPPEAHIALYRIAQEALNNVLKHSRAAHVVMNLNCILGRNHQVQVVELTIRDDGRGFDVNQVSSSRLGLASMRERAQAIGAELSVDSHPGRGAEIKVVWDNTQNEEGD